MDLVMLGKVKSIQGHMDLLFDYLIEKFPPESIREKELISQYLKRKMLMLKRRKEKGLLIPPRKNKHAQVK